MNVTQTPIWFSTHKFDMLDELLNENQRANTIIVYNYVEELAELKRKYLTHRQLMIRSRLHAGTQVK